MGSKNIISLDVDGITEDGLRGTSGAAHVADQAEKAGGLYNTDGTWPKTETVTAQPKHLNDIPNYTGHATQAAVGAGEINTITLSAGTYATGIYVNPWGPSTFSGVYVTVNAADSATARSRLQSVEGSSTLRYFVPNGKPRTLKFTSEITRVDVTAIDSAADNNLEVEFY